MNVRKRSSITFCQHSLALSVVNCPKVCDICFSYSVTCLSVVVPCVWILLFWESYNTYFEEFWFFIWNEIRSIVQMLSFYSHKELSFDSGCISYICVYCNCIGENFYQFIECLDYFEIGPWIFRNFCLTIELYELAFRNHCLLKRALL